MTRMTSLRALIAGAIAATLALLLAGCSTPAAEPHTWGAVYDYGTPGAVASVTSGVVYYPPCGNEVLPFGDVTWFPFAPSNGADLPPDPLSAAPSPMPGPDAGADGAGPIGAVAAPGPGDDVGTLVVYDNDLAYWEADSGRFSEWLTTREIEYNWAC